MSRVAINVIEIHPERSAFAVALPSTGPDAGSLQIAFEDLAKATRWVLVVPRTWRIDMGIALLAADGDRVKVTLTKPRPKKGQPPADPAKVTCGACVAGTKLGHVTGAGSACVKRPRTGARARKAAP